MSIWISCFLLLLYGEFFTEAIDANQLLRNSIKSHGYPVELHPVESSDGYRLTMVRIPAPGKPILFLMHAFVSSSFDYTLMGPGRALAFLGHDSGFDVWLANGRGNTFSRLHRSVSPSKSEFWKFSFHEVGIYDLPAMIDHALNVTGRDKVHYVGHSQGSVNFLVMASTRPEYNGKIASAHLSSPVAFWSRNTTPLSYLYEEVFPWIKLFERMGYNEIGGRTDSDLIAYLHAAIQGGCVTEDLLLTASWLIVGEHRETFNNTSMRMVMDVVPAGASLRQLLHFLQTYKSGRFCQYDYGEEENLKRYGKTVPPDYALGDITAPVALYYGLNDPLVAVEDLELLMEKLPNITLKYQHPDPKWNHIDFIYGSHGRGVHQVLLKLAKQYEA